MVLALAGAPGQALALVVLGTLFNLGGTAVNLLVALAAARVAGQLAASRASGGGGAAWLQRAAGAMFIGLGLKLALSPK